MSSVPSSVNWIASNENVNVILNGIPRTFRLDTDQGRKLHAALRRNPQDLDEIRDLADVRSYLTRVSFGRVEIDHQDQIYIDGRPVDYGLKQMIVGLLREGGDVTPFVRFLENVDQNPDKDIAPYVYAFLEKGGCPITPDGCFLAFKRVNANYFSFWSGKEEVIVSTPGWQDKGVQDESGRYVATYLGHIPHWIGSILSMDRSLCDPQRTQTCSVGLHACTFTFLPRYHGGNGRVVIVKINPKDVTAVPNDYNDSKLRCCRLEVVAEVPESEASKRFQTVLETSFDEPIDDEDEDDSDDLDDLDDVTDENEDQDDEELEDLPTYYPRDLAIESGGLDGVAAFHEDSEVGIFNVDFHEGDSYFEVPAEFQNIYALNYCESYAGELVLEEHYDHTIYQQGVDDGALSAGVDMVKGTFDCNVQGGNHWQKIKETAHDRTYAKGFVEGYTSKWVGDLV